MSELFQHGIDIGVSLLKYPRPRISFRAAEQSQTNSRVDMVWDGPDYHKSHHTILCRLILWVLLLLHANDGGYDGSKQSVG